MNIVMAVSMGGDDFIAKPFDLEVLTAKVQAMLRRTYDFTGQSAVLEHKGAMLNLTEAALFNFVLAATLENTEYPATVSSCLCVPVYYKSLPLLETAYCEMLYVTIHSSK